MKYDENFRLALENFEKALKYDPLWNEPKEQLESLIKHLDNMQNLIEKKVLIFWVYLYNFLSLPLNWEKDYIKDSLNWEKDAFIMNVF